MTTTIPADVAAFAAAVRADFDDLPAEELEELTDGLESDLAERLAESEGRADLGDPHVYAAELRSAAGLPPRAERPTQLSWWAGLASAISGAARRLRADARTVAGRFPLLGSTVAFLLALRPVWWVLRAAGLTAVLAAVLRLRPELAVLAALPLLVLSVQWGRGRWLPWRWSRPAVWVLSLVALIGLLGSLAVLPRFASGSGSDSAESYAVPSSDIGLNQSANDGSSTRVTNIFAYDANGQPVSVRLYDQDGRPITTTEQPSSAAVSRVTTADGSSLTLTPLAGATLWNSFPLGSVTDDSVGVNGLLKPNAVITPAPAPYASVAPLPVIASPASSSTAPAQSATVAAPTPSPTPAG